MKAPVFHPGVTEPQRRTQVWAEPIEGHEYVIGADFAYGIGRDRDAAVVLDITERPVVQVAEMAGQWGEQFDEPLARLGRWYNNAFILGESQVGHPILARMARNGYPFLYKERREDAITKAPILRYGWARTYDDLALRNFRAAVFSRRVVLLSPALLDEMAELEYYQPSDNDARSHDDDTLRLRLPQDATGRRPSPDLTMAAAYAWHAFGERPKFEADQPRKKPETPLEYAQSVIDEQDKELLR